MKSLATFAASIVLVTAVADNAHAQVPNGVAAPWGPFPPVKHALEIRRPQGGFPALNEVLNQLAEASSVVFSADVQTAKRLEETALRLTADVVVPAESAYAFVESLLEQHEFFVSVMHPGEPLTVGVHGALNGAWRVPHFDVPPEHMAFLRAHPALRVQSNVVLASIDVLTLGNSLRSLNSGDPFGEPIPNTHGVVLRGTGRVVADLIAVLKRVDADSAADSAPAASPVDVAARAALAAAAAASKLPPVWDAFPPAKRALELRMSGDKRPTLADLLAQLAESTGVVFLTDPFVEAQTSKTAINLSSAAVVSPDIAWPFAEQLLLQNRLILSVVCAGAQPVIGVHGNAPQGTRGSSAVVPVEHLDFLRDHPALYVQTSLNLPSVDVRTLGNSLRGLSSDGDGNILPVANSNDVVLVGTARDVVALVDLLLSIEANCAAAVGPPTYRTDAVGVNAPPLDANSANGAALGVTLPLPSHALEIRMSEDRKPRLGDLLKQVSAATGVVFTTSTGIEEMMNSALINLSADAVVPAGEVWSFFEALMLENSCVLSLLSTGTPALVGVYSTRMPGVRASSVNVRVEALDFLRAHPALLVQTSLSLASVDVRALGNSLRALGGNDTVSALVPVANTHSLVVVGTGKYVVDMVELLQRVDADCAAGLKLEDAVKRELDAEPTKK